ncbi:calcium-binding protein [Rhizobium leguminosarum]|uniref:calcium-binding protein n=2 Tax=Rhizobium leguminosarum TaxID=384 RepID=UPI0013EEFE8E|nr:calcium-binding protein [Rhizobium leguminosarum]
MADNSGGVDPAVFAEAAQHLFNQLKEGFSHPNFEASFKAGLVAQFGSAIGDVAELLNAAYEPFIYGFQTGDWSKLGETVFEFGLSSAIGSFVVGAAAVGVGITLGTTAAEIFAIGVVAVGISDGINAALSLATKIFDDLTEAIQPQEQPSQQLLDDLLIRRLLGHLYDQDNPNFQLKDVLRQLVTLASAEGPDFRLTGPSGPYDAEHATLVIGTANSDKITSTDDNDVIFSGAGDDVVTARGGKDIVLGGAGSDIFIDSVTEGTEDGRSNEDDIYVGSEAFGDVSQNFHNWLSGGGETDIVRYTVDSLVADDPETPEDEGRLQQEGVRVTDLSLSNIHTIQTVAITVEDRAKGNAATDQLIGIEKVELSDRPDELIVKDHSLDVAILIDMGKSGRIESELPVGEALTSDAFTIKVDVVDYSGLSHGINYLNGVTSDHDDVDTLDNIFQWQGYDQELLTIVDYAAKGALGYNNALHVQGADQVKLSDHDDVLISADFGSIITTGEGQDKVWFTNGIGVTDLSADDRIALGGVLTLYGGLKNEASEDPYAWGPYGTSYGLNAQGELVIRNAFWHVTNPDGTPSDEVATMYVLNWKDRTTLGPGGEGEVGPGGIFLAEYHMSFVRFRDIAQDMKGQYSVLGEGAFDILGLMIKTMTGHYPWGGQDPLVLDLDGDGIELTALDRSKSKLDLDNDLYSESSGFVGKDDGVLVRDLNGDGKITGSNEMFGNATTSGLVALALLDGNHDGKVDATDSGLADFNGDGAVNTADTFSSLLVWQDANENHITDAGELKSVAERGIASINVTPNTATTTQTVNGNTIASTAGYTLADGTVRTIADVVLKLDNQNTTYVGTPIQVSQSVLDLADLKGRGTLVSLHEAMSALPTAETAVRAAVQTLTSPVLSALREAIRPILTAWAEGSPVKIGANIITGTAGLTAYDDLAIVRKDGNVVDYAWGVSSSGDDTSDIPGIRMASGVIVSSSEGTSARGELSGLLSQWTGGGSSIVVTTGTELHNGVSVSYLDYRNGDDYLRIYNYQKADWSSGLASSATHTLGSGIAVDTVAGTDFSFYERLIGESLQAFFDVPDSATAGYQAVAAFLDKMDDALNLFAVRLAVQSGPLAHYFESIDYSAQSDGFTSKSGSQIAAVFTALLADAEQSSNAVSWLTEWKPFFDVFLSDYSRGSASQKNTYAFLAQNMLNAVEQNAGGISVVDFAHAFGMAQDLFFTGTGEVNGSGADDILIIDGGETIVRGGTGADSYIIGKTFQSTEIFDDDGIGGSVDTIRFSAHNADNIIASREGIDLLLTDTVTGAVIRVSNQFEGRWPSMMTGDLSHDYGINQIVFKDGSVWTKVEIAEAVSKIDDASTHIVGTEDIDILQGGKGDDLLEGAGDTDIYRYGRGDGKDTINDYEGNAFRNDQDMLQFLDGIRSGDLIFQRDGASNDLVIHFKDRPLDQITIQGQFAATYTGPYGTWYMNRIDLFTFDDGSSLTSDQVASIVLQANSTDGNDQLYGMEREDILRAGKGDDFISGGNQNDIYLYALGDGHDVIQDRMTNILSGTVDVLRFGAGIGREDISFSRVEGDRNSIIIHINGGEGSITLLNEFSYAASGVFGDIFFDRIERIDFTSGDQSIAWNEIATTVIAAQKTEGMDVIEGFNLDDVLDGGAGDDTLYGYDGNDTYVWGRGYGNDKIEERGFGALSGGDFDTVIFHDNVTADNVVVSRTMGTNDIILTLKDTGETLTLIEQVSYNAIGYRPQQVDIIRFSDGLEWSAGDIQARYFLDAKTAGDDHIVGFWTDNTLDGGAGNDLLEGGDGSDTYVFGYGYGHDEIRESYGIVLYADDDAVRFASGVDVADVTFQRSGEYGLLISLAGSDDTLLVANEFYLEVWDMNDVERFQFSDGTVLTREQIGEIIVGNQITSGNDTIVSFDLNETINGGAGNDSIDARGGADEITGGRGDDAIIGGGGNDVFYYSRGDGDDIVHEYYANGGSDRLAFSDILAADVRLSRSGNDLTIIVGEDTTTTDDDGQILLADEFNVDLLDTTGVETVVFADGAAFSNRDLAKWILSQSFTAGNDNYVGFVFDDVISSGDGDDIIDAAGGNDTINGGLGNDKLEGLGGSDLFLYALGDGSDTITDSVITDASDRLKFSDLNATDVTVTRNGADLILLVGEGSNANASIVLKDVISSHNYGIDQIVFADGEVWNRSSFAAHVEYVGGTSGNETITGSSSADEIHAGLGNDTLIGGADSDTYIYLAGDGNDVIDDATSGSDIDVLRLDNLLMSDVRFERLESAPNNAIIHILATGETITLKDQFNPGSGVESIVFGDGEVMGGAPGQLDDALKSLLAIKGTDGNDIIVGTGMDDAFKPGGGNDTIDSGGGNDTIYYARGDGNDTVTESGMWDSDDRLVLSGINPADVTLVRNGNDVTLVIAESTVGAGDAGSILIKDNLNEYYQSGIDKIVFADGTVWSRADLRAMLVNFAGTSGNDVITGSNATDIINALAGNDTINAGDGNDVITGATGSDTIDSGWGNDTIYYARGDGNDAITESGMWDTDDRLVLSGINPADVTLARNGNDVTLVIAESAAGEGDGGSILLSGNLNEYYQSGIEKVVFADGTTWTRDTMRAALLAQASTSGDDLIIGFNVADVINAGAGNDAINAGDGNDVITGGTGNDTIDSGWGNDTIYYARGDGNDAITESGMWDTDDRLVLSGINPADVTLARNGNDVTLVIAESAAGAGDGGSILLSGNLNEYYQSGIEKVVFADGTTWTRDTMRVALLAQASTSGDDVIIGFNVADVINAGAGNDTINTGDGNDVITGGTGNDTIDSGWGNDTIYYARGDGNDAITESGMWDTDDRLVLSGINPADVTLARNGNDVTLVIAESAAGAGDGGSILLSGNLNEYYQTGLEKVVFADGTTWTRDTMRVALLAQASTSGDDVIIGFNVADVINAGAGNDTINTGDGNDVITGGTGNDTIDSGWGNDTIYYARGDGNDAITESGMWDTDDRLVLSGINPADVTLARNGNDVTLVIAESAAGAGDGGSILLSGNLNEYYQTGLEKVVFADGTIWGRADLRSNISYVGGTSGNDTITGTTDADNIHAGMGDDTLIGLAGDDAFVFRPGFGHDTINDFVAGAQSVDIIDIGNDLFADFASVLAAASQVGVDTVITHDANTSITLKNVALTSLHQDDFRFTAAA